MTDPILDTIDAALTDWDVSPDAMRWAPDAKPPPPPIVFSFVIDTAPFVAAMEGLAVTLRRIDFSGLTALVKAIEARQGPVPLSIDGHAYRRRQCARRRRRNR